MRKQVFIANWKMNLPNISFEFYLEEIKNIKLTDTKVIVAVPFPYLYQANQIVNKPTSTPTSTQDKKSSNNIMIAAQNIHTESKGAYTGEVSAEMLHDLDIPYVIIGHSERRQYFGETNETITKKIEQASNKDINVVFCIGETVDERETNKTFDVIKEQLSILKQFNTLSKIIIAYEPVWAIGTGLTATSQQAQEVHSFIREWIKENFNKDIAETATIIYGGSIKPENIAELINQPDIDGGLVGGASLSLQKFIDIINVKTEVNQNSTNSTNPTSPSPETSKIGNFQKFLKRVGTNVMNKKSTKTKIHVK